MSQQLMIFYIKQEARASLFQSTRRFLMEEYSVLSKRFLPILVLNVLRSCSISMSVNL